VIALALAIFWFGGLRVILLFLLAWLITIFGDHCIFLISVLVGQVESSFTIVGCLLEIFLRRSGSLTPFRKAAMATASLTPGMVFFFFMNHLMNSRRDSSF